MKRQNRTGKNRICMKGQDRSGKSRIGMKGQDRTGKGKERTEWVCAVQG